MQLLNILNTTLEYILSMLIGYILIGYILIEYILNIYLIYLLDMLNITLEYTQYTYWIYA